MHAPAPGPPRGLAPRPAGPTGRAAPALAGALIASAIAVSTSFAAARPAPINVNPACYVITRSIPTIALTGSGFSPGDQVAVSDNLRLVDIRTTVNAAGHIAVSFPAPSPSFTSPSVKRDTITARDLTATGAEIVASTTTEITMLGAEHGATKPRPGLRALSEKTKWSFSGFPVGRTIYGHYTLKGKQVARVAFGRAQGPCGLLTVDKPLFPATPKHTSYPVQIDSSERYSRRTTPAIPLTVSLGFTF